MLKQEILEESRIHIGYIFFFVTAVGFICSLTYNHGYFWHFDAGINVLSIADILTSYTLWIPSLGTVIFGYGLDLFLKHIEDEKNNKSEKFKKFKQIMKILLATPQTVLFFGVLILLSCFLIFGYPNNPLIVWLGCLFLWLKLSSYLMSSKVFAGRTNKYILGIFLFVPVVLSLMFVLGLEKSMRDSRLDKPTANLYFINEPNIKHPTILLRHLEKGLLAKHISINDYIVFTWDDINRIEIISRNSYYFSGML